MLSELCFRESGDIKIEIIGSLISPGLDKDRSFNDRLLYLILSFYS